LSSIFAQDDSIHNFAKVASSLSDWDFAMGNATVEAIANIKKVPPLTLMEYFPTIANELFQIMCTRQEAAVRQVTDFVMVDF